MNFHKVHPQMSSIPLTLQLDFQTPAGVLTRRAIVLPKVGRRGRGGAIPLMGRIPHYVYKDGAEGFEMSSPIGDAMNENNIKDILLKESTRRYMRMALYRKGACKKCIFVPDPDLAEQIKSKIANRIRGRSSEECEV